ncbi:hypothetical protein O181_028833 [Austropuccinia psidii MF-1]|uniref:H/ACA ribonucleoprotein complex subunit 2 n=1 Tax=Austropuccinia psidii MF-1 TaxID=1389203 RepID=A0A9Q3CUM7_9BASI|nr:hypothetical protein [Austropuccinia psidii MF-1]
MDTSMASIAESHKSSSKKRKSTDGKTRDPTAKDGDLANRSIGTEHNSNEKKKKHKKNETNDGEGKKKKKKQKEKPDSDDDEADQNEGALSPIAHPLADKKLGKRVLRTVKKGAKQRLIKRGVKEVVKALQKGEKGLVVMAGDISPMDVLTHIPLLAEENGSGYIFVPTKGSLGSASYTKRPTSCVMITDANGGSAAAKKKREAQRAALIKANPEKAQKLKEDEEDYLTSYQTVFSEVQKLNETISY